MKHETIEEAARRRSFRERLRSSKEKLLSSRSMLVLGCVLIGQGAYAIRVGLEGELDRLETDRTFNADTRRRVFTLETILEAEGIIKDAAKASDEPADPDAGGEPAPSSDEPAAGSSSDDGEKADLEGDEWRVDDAGERIFPGTEIPE